MVPVFRGVHVIRSQPNLPDRDSWPLFFEHEKGLPQPLIRPLPNPESLRFHRCNNSGTVIAKGCMNVNNSTFGGAHFRSCRQGPGIAWILKYYSFFK